jgi:hypothetical protein
MKFDGVTEDNNQHLTDVEHEIHNTLESIDTLGSIVESSTPHELTPCALPEPSPEIPPTQNLLEKPTPADLAVTDEPATPLEPAAEAATVHPLSDTVSRAQEKDTTIYKSPAESAAPLHGSIDQGAIISLARNIATLMVLIDTFKLYNIIFIFIYMPLRAFIIVR